MKRGMEKKKRHIVRTIFSVLAGIILVVVVTAVVLYQGQVRTICALKSLDDNSIYEMNYKTDYHFDDFLKQGASSDREAIGFAVDKIIFAGVAKSEDLSFGCSTFSAKLANGDAVFGRNFDFSASVPLVLHTKPSDGYESISMVDLHNVGLNKQRMEKGELMDKLTTLTAPYVPMDGMNEKGVSMAVLQLNLLATNQQTEKTDITTTTAIRLVLDHAATTDEAVELLQNYDMHSSIGSCFHFQIADASGKSVIVEYKGNEMKVLPIDDDYQVCTNFMVSDLKEGDIPACHRYNTMTETLMKKSGVLSDEKEGMALLEAVKQGHTQWSCIYNNSALTLDVCLTGDYGHIYCFKIKDNTKR